MKNCAMPLKIVVPRRCLADQGYRAEPAEFRYQRFDIPLPWLHSELDAWVVLGFDPRENPQVSRPNAKLSVRAEWAVKRTLFQAFCRKPLIWMDSYESSRRVLASLAGDASAGPGFDYKVKGELASAPLLDCFVAAPGFIENLGLDVPDAVGQMSFAKDDPDRFFFEA
jgi:hypothetical protein